MKTVGLRILHLTPSIAHGSYGLGQVAVNLVKAQQKLNEDPVIWCLDSEPEKRAEAEAWGLPPGTVRSFKRDGPRLTGWSSALVTAMKEEGHQFDVLHQHGIWTGISYAAKTFSTALGRPTVVAPHGSLHRFALAKSPWKKRLASVLYESSNLKNTACLHALAEPEVDSFRQYGLTNPIALIKNGVSDEWLAREGDSALFRETHSIPADRRILLYMSRIAREKGLSILLKAWAALEGRRLRWLLVIVGGDVDGHRKECENLATHLGIESSVRFLGPIFGQGRRDALAAADLFVLPTYSEGAPLVVLECLGAGVPAVVTRGAAWADLETYGCGWWVETSTEGIRSGLESAMNLPPEKLRAMGLAGRSLVADRYNWRTLAEQTVALYRWLVTKTGKPEFVTN